MILPTIATGIFMVCIAAWLLAEAMSSHRLWLAIAIPFMLAAPFGLYVYTGTLLGRALDAMPPDGFELVHSYTDEQAKAVYALVRLKGDPAPRLYRITADFAKNRKAFGDAQDAVGHGMPMAGKSKGKGGAPQGGKGDGSESEGAVEFYMLPPAGIPPKEQ